MSIFQKALSSGFTQSQILNFISNINPQVGTQIKRAKSSGFSPAQIINFLSNIFSGGEKVRGGTAAFQENLSGERAKQVAKDIGSLALTAGGAYAATKALPSLAQGARGIFGGQGSPQATQQPAPPQVAPQGAGPTSPPIGPAPMSNAPVHPSPVSSPQSPNIGVAAGAVQQPQQPAPPQQANPINSANILNQMGLTDKIDNLKNAGNSPESILAGVQTTLRPQQNKWLDEQIKTGKAKPLPEMINEYLTTNQQPKPTELVEEPPQTPQKGSIVATPDGIVGSIKDMRNKEALVESDGKLHKAKLDDLAQSPLQDKDSADLVDELNAEIEKETGEQVSRAVRLVAYNPEENLLLFVPWGGQPYAYDDLDEEEKNFLINNTQKRRTTGENQIGVWEEGTKSPFGSKMSDFIRNLQAKRGGKGNEYLAKFEYIYDPHGHAINLQKKKYQESKKKKKS